MNESVSNAERAAAAHAQAISASISTLLFETLGIFRQGDSATAAEQMACADDLMNRLVSAIDTHFGPGIGSYAIARQNARRSTGAAITGKITDEETETLIQAIKRRQEAL